ncbi:MAG: PIN domain-containing protein [Solirubrobacterales bacterium]
MSASVVLDAGVLIAYLDAEDAHHDSATIALGQIDADVELITSSVSLSEALVSPAHRGSELVEQALYSIKSLAGVGVVPVDEATAVGVALLRSRHRTLRTPDAVVIATARRVGADFALTTDNRLARMDEAVSVKQFLAGRG